MVKSNNKTEIVRVKKDRDYTVINNTCLRDDRLSWKAKGIMAYILTLPDDWNIYLEEVMKHAPDGEKAFRSGLKELKEFGYVERVQIRCEETKRIIGWQTIVNEKPQTLDNTLLAQNLHVGNLQVEKLHVENEGLLNTELTNYLPKQSTELKNIVQDKLERDFEDFYSNYPIKKGKANAVKAYKKARKNKNTHEQIMNGLFNYKRELELKGTDKQFIKQPATFLNGEHFNDEYDLIPVMQNGKQLKPWEAEAYGQTTSWNDNVNDRSGISKSVPYKQLGINL